MIPPVIPLRLKIEINTREHFAVFDALAKPIAIDSLWFTGSAEIRTYALDELLATKLRGLPFVSKMSSCPLWASATLAEAR